PGASRSMTLRVASGVTSSGVSPVPPVVNTNATPASTCARSRASISRRSSATISVATTSAPASRAACASLRPDTSSPSPRARDVEIVMIAACIAASLRLPAPVLLAAGLLQQGDLLDDHAPLDALDHVVDR